MHLEKSRSTMSSSSSSTSLLGFAREQAKYSPRHSSTGVRFYEDDKAEQGNSSVVQKHEPEMMKSNSRSLDNAKALQAELLVYDQHKEEKEIFGAAEEETREAPEYEERKEMPSNDESTANYFKMKYQLQSELRSLKEMDDVTEQETRETQEIEEREEAPSNDKSIEHYLKIKDQLQSQMMPTAQELKHLKEMERMAHLRDEFRDRQVHRVDNDDLEASAEEKVAIEKMEKILKRLERKEKEMKRRRERDRAMRRRSREEEIEAEELLEQIEKNKAEAEAMFMDATAKIRSQIQNVDIHVNKAEAEAMFMDATEKFRSQIQNVDIHGSLPEEVKTFKTSILGVPIQVSGQDSLFSDISEGAQDAIKSQKIVSNWSVNWDEVARSTDDATNAILGHVASSLQVLEQHQVAKRTSSAKEGSKDEEDK